MTVVLTPGQRAMQRVRAVPFALVLPALSLLVWLAVLLVPIQSQLHALRAATGGTRNANVGLDDYHATIVPAEFLPFAVNAAIVTHTHALTALYLPGTLVAMPLALATTNPADWYTHQLNHWTLRALSQPLDTLPFFLLVGAAIDALLRHRRLSQRVLGFGTALCAIFAGVLVRFTYERATHASHVAWWVLAGFAMWALLFATLPIAWLVQRRRDREDAA